MGMDPWTGRETRGNGWDAEHNMSVNAYSAYKAGERPMSKALAELPAGAPKAAYRRLLESLQMTQAVAHHIGGLNGDRDARYVWFYPSRDSLAEQAESFLDGDDEGNDLKNFFKTNPKDAKKLMAFFLPDQYGRSMKTLDALAESKDDDKAFEAKRKKLEKEEQDQDSVNDAYYRNNNDAIVKKAMALYQKGLEQPYDWEKYNGIEFTPSDAIESRMDEIRQGISDEDYRKFADDLAKGSPFQNDAKYKYANKAMDEARSRLIDEMAKSKSKEIQASWDSAANKEYKDYYDKLASKMAGLIKPGSKWSIGDDNRIYKKGQPMTGFKDFGGMVPIGIYRHQYQWEGRGIPADFADRIRKAQKAMGSQNKPVQPQGQAQATIDQPKPAQAQEGLGKPAKTSF